MQANKCFLHVLMPPPMRGDTLSTDKGGGQSLYEAEFDCALWTLQGIVSSYHSLIMTPTISALCLRASAENKRNAFYKITQFGVGGGGGWGTSSNI